MQVPIKIFVAEAKTKLKSQIVEHCREFDTYHRDEEYFKTFYFLWYDEDTKMDRINLDSDNYDEHFVGYIINGNLSSKRILNYETDYGVHLIILGNLDTDYMAVGGQDIYITGDLDVKILLVGSYNHGRMNIEGNLNCPLVITNDYSCVVEGKMEGENIAWGDPVCLWRNGEQTYPPYNQSELEDHFEDSFLNEYESVEFEVIVKAIDNEEEIPRKYVLDIERDGIISDEVRQISDSTFLNPRLGEQKKIEKEGDYYYASREEAMEELVIQETWQSHKYVIIENQLKVYFKGEKDVDFKEFFIGSNRYRKAKRLIKNKVWRIQFWR